MYYLISRPDWLIVRAPERNGPSTTANPCLLYIIHHLPERSILESSCYPLKCRLDVFLRNQGKGRQFPQTAVDVIPFSVRIYEIESIKKC